MTTINPLQSLINNFSASNTMLGEQKSSGSLFSTLMQNTGNNAIKSLKNAEKISIEGLSDTKVNLHELVASLNEAEMSLKMVLTIRDKITQSIQEIMRMQI